MSWQLGPFSTAATNTMPEDAICATAKTWGVLISLPLVERLSRGGEETIGW